MTMSIAESMLPEWDAEVASTRKLLAVLPDGHASFKPHEKSMDLGRLALHVAEIPEWMGMTIGTPELDFAKFDYKPPTWSSADDVRARFEKSVTAARQALAGTSDATMMENWTMRQGEQVYFTMPKVAVLRSFVFNHLVHHRAQLGVYLRMNNVAIPGMYGPSADEPM
jgi:uncharacterized damage-inducible protein DinB